MEIILNLFGGVFNVNVQTKITNCRGFTTSEIQIKGENPVDEIAKQIESFKVVYIVYY